MKMKTSVALLISLALFAAGFPVHAAAKESANYLSHPPIRELPAVSHRPLADGPSYFVDPARGDDASNGSEKSPWKTIRHGLSELSPGDTLVLRDGVYFENIRCSPTGTAEKPITIRSHPGERAIIDGGFREFFESPATAWVPSEGGAPGEYRSARRYRNITGVSGMFGDSAIGLHTYWLLTDLRATNEQWGMNPEKKIFDGALYAGPGLWHDAHTGYIHCRLAHTHNNNPLVADYRGETDPRKLPLVIAPLNAVPLHLEHAQHVRVQDLVIRGGGENSVLLQYCANVELDGVFVQCGSLNGQHSGPAKITHSAIHGRVPPWMWRIDSSKGCASGASRDIVRLVTPTLFDTSLDFEPLAIPRVVHNEILNSRTTGDRAAPLEGEDAKTPQMIHYPANHDWEISWSEITDGHDGVFLAGRNMNFHHNLVDNMQDDALDISCPLPRADDTLYITQNLIRRSVTPLSSHNYDIQWKRGKVFITRNVFDSCLGVQWIRPDEKHPQGDLKCNATFFLHGGDHAQFIESVYFYQNTCIAPTSGPYAFGHGTLAHLKPGCERRVFNNVFIYLNETGSYPLPFYGNSTTSADIQVDGNLHWNPLPTAKVPPNFFEKLRTHKLSESNKDKYPAGFGLNELTGDPRFASFKVETPATNDYRVGEGSAAIGKGVELPADWPDPLRPSNGTRPDIGALPRGAGPLSVGLKGNSDAAPKASAKK